VKIQFLQNEDYENKCFVYMFIFILVNYMRMLFKVHRTMFVDV